MVRTVRRRMAALLVVPALALAAVAGAPATAGANAPASISGCWSWDVDNGCTRWAECYVYGSHYTCFITENFHGFVYTYSTSG